MFTPSSAIQWTTQHGLRRLEAAQDGEALDRSTLCLLSAPMCWSTWKLKLHARTEWASYFPVAGKWGIRSMLTVRAHMPKCNSESPSWPCLASMAVEVKPWLWLLPPLSGEPFWGRVLWSLGDNGTTQPFFELVSAPGLKQPWQLPVQSS